MDNTQTSINLLLDLEARHEDLIRRLEELDQRVERVLAECQVYRLPQKRKRANAA